MTPNPNLVLRLLKDAVDRTIEEKVEEAFAATVHAADQLRRVASVKYEALPQEADELWPVGAPQRGFLLAHHDDWNVYLLEPGSEEDEYDFALYQTDEGGSVCIPCPTPPLPVDWTRLHRILVLERLIEVAASWSRTQPPNGRSELCAELSEKIAMLAVDAS